MATVQITGQPGGIVKPQQTTSVFVKRNWVDEWEYVPYLFAEFAVEEAGSGNSHAGLIWNYGSIMQHDRTAFVMYTTLRLQNWFVGIQSNSAFGSWKVWIGIITSEVLDEFSVSTDLSIDAGVPFLYGDQPFGAVGLEWLIKRRRINGTYGPGNIFIDRTAVFNRRYDRGAQLFQGNRSTSRDSDNVFTFSDDNEVWTYRDILEYVVKKFGPPGITFEFWGLIDSLDQFTGTFDFGGVRIWDVLNTLIDNRRGFGWRILSTGAGTIGIYVFSVLKDPLSFAGVTIPANTWQDTPIFDDKIDLHPSLHVTQAHNYDRVIVRGARLKTCMSLSVVNGTLEKAWTDAEETAYEGDSDEERKTDKHERVFTTFRIPADWDWTYTSLFNSTTQNANPTVNFDGTVNPGAVGTFWNAEHRLLNYLPFEVAATDSEAEPELRKPFVLIEDPGATNEYHYAEAMQHIEGESFRSYRFRMLQREFGFLVKGSQNHLLGLNTFTDGGSPATEFPAEVDYQRMVATVFFETDSHLQVDIAIPSGEDSGRGQDLLINVPDAEYWFVAGGTVRDVTDKAVVFNNGGAAEAVRDDGYKLRAIAVAAQAWYSGAKNLLSYRHDGIADFHPVGMMIRAVANVAFELADVGTPVTRRRWDFRRNLTFVETGFSDFNTGVVGTSRLSKNTLPGRRQNGRRR